MVLDKQPQRWLILVDQVILGMILTPFCNPRQAGRASLDAVSDAEYVAHLEVQLWPSHGTPQSSCVQRSGCVGACRILLTDATHEMQSAGTLAMHLADMAC